MGPRVNTLLLCQVLLFCYELILNKPAGVWHVTLQRSVSWRLCASPSLSRAQASSRERALVLSPPPPPRCPLLSAPHSHKARPRGCGCARLHFKYFYIVWSWEYFTHIVYMQFWNVTHCKYDTNMMHCYFTYHKFVLQLVCHCWALYSTATFRDEKRPNKFWWWNECARGESWVEDWCPGIENGIPSSGM